MTEVTTDSIATGSQVEQPRDFQQGADKAAGQYRRWMAELKLYAKEFKNWKERSNKIIKRYRDERSDTDDRRKFNVLWSNLETLKPAVYARVPVPDVQRRFKDADPVGRVSSTVLERCLAFTVDDGNLDGCLRKVRDDYLLVGRGVAWARYEFEEGDEQQGTDGQAFRPVADEDICFDYVFWQDFAHSPARTWEDVTWVGKRTYMTRDALIERFGSKIGNEVKLDTKPANMSDDEVGKHGETFKQAEVWEIWDKEGDQVVWVSKGYRDKLLEQGEPPIDFDDFWPCPKPLYATTTTDTLVPVPDVSEYQDQMQELDTLTERISLLAQSLKVAGLYDASMKAETGQILELQSIIGPKAENIMIPVSNWAAFAEKGGLPGSMTFLPIETVMQVIQGLYEARAQTKQDLLEITGLADIIRGASDPNETATAQQIKGRFATLRLTDRQNEVARFGRDMLRLAAEIIAEQFSAETLAKMSDMQLPKTEMERQMLTMQAQMPAAPPAVIPGAAAPSPQMPMASMLPMGQGPGLPGSPAAAPPGPAPIQHPPAIPEASWESVMALLRDNTLREFRIDIETDSTIAVDENQQKQDATEFLGAVTPFLQQMGLAAQQLPESLPLLGEILMQVVRQFKWGRNLEDTFEQTLEQMKSMAAMPKPDPAEREAKLEEAKAAAQIKIKQAQTQADLQLAQQKAAADLQLKKAEMQGKLGMEAQKMRMEHGLKQQEMVMDHGLKQDQLAGDQSLEAQRLAHEQATADAEPAGKSKPNGKGGTTIMLHRGPDGKLIGATVH